MATVDLRGNPVGTSEQGALALAERALWRMVSFYGDPLPDLADAEQADPRWMLPAVMRAAFLLTMTEPSMVADARAALVRAESLTAHATERERAQLAATRACAEGNWHRACDLWDRVLLDHPRDMLALICAHLFDFYRGDALNLRQRVARVRPEWSHDDPLYAHVLGMHAFGLEESNLYAQAEEAGRAAVAADPRAPWAIHAVTHVMEMQGRHDDGTAWLMSRRADWAIDNGLSVHSGWHLALFHLERLDFAGALALYDAHIATEGAQAIHLQRLDAAALLWRLHLLGADVGDRWRVLADRYAGAINDAGYYAFNDLFALLAFVGVRDFDFAQAVLAAAEARAVDDRGSNRAMALDVGLPLMRGVLAFARGNFDQAAELMHPARAIAHRFGGSHAQRDVIDQTLLACGVDGSHKELGGALLNERLFSKPTTPLTLHWAERLGQRVRFTLAP